MSAVYRGSIPFDQDDGAAYGTVNQEDVIYQGERKPVNRRQRLNLLPVLLNLFLPWFVFCVCFFSFSSRFHHVWPGASTVVYVLTCLPAAFLWFVWTGGKANSLYKGQGFDFSKVPKSWLGYAVFAFTVATVVGGLSGYFNYTKYLLPYYEATDMQSLMNANPAVARGSFMLDAGRVYWAEGTELDFERSWHFKNGDIYCVVPIVMRNQTDETIIEPASSSYDFWAVGKNCCSVGASDFNCGEYKNPNALASLRETRSEDIEMYRLAVMQAESLFDMQAAQPLFFDWVEDPVEKLTAVRSNASSNGMLTCFAMLGFFSVSLAVTIAWVQLAEYRKRRQADREAEAQAAYAAAQQDF